MDRCEGGIEGWTDVRGDRGVDRCWLKREREAGWTDVRGRESWEGGGIEADICEVERKRGRELEGKTERGVDRREAEREGAVGRGGGGGESGLWGRESGRA